MSVIDNIKHALAGALIVGEKVSDEVAAWRMSICQACEHRRDNVCGVCGCFLDLKAKSATNFNPAKMRNEVTHCPLGKWNDEEIANHYRSLE